MFDKWYSNLVREIMESGGEEFNERTGLRTKIVTGVSHSFQPAQDFPLLSLRKIPLKLFIAEIIWYLQGDKKLDFFQKFSRIWDDFKDEAEENSVETCYGYRWRHFFGRDQVSSLISMLKEEPSSRQGVVITWDPSSDGLSSPKKKNVPCVPLWMANIVGGKLNIHFIFRSQDVMLGLPHDIAGFALLQLILAQELNVEAGFLHYSGSHCHIYENHYVNAKDILTRYNNQSPIKLVLPVQTYQRALHKDESLVQEIYESLRSQYKPLGKMERMQIAL